MTAEHDGHTARSDDEGGVVIAFPTNRTPPPLPRLPRAFPTPGSGQRVSDFAAVMTRRFDQEAA